MVKSHDKFASAEEKLAHFYVYPHNTLTAKNLDLHTQNSQKNARRIMILIFRAFLSGQTGKYTTIANSMPHFPTPPLLATPNRITQKAGNPYGKPAFYCI